MSSQTRRLLLAKARDLVFVKVVGDADRLLFGDAIGTDEAEEVETARRNDKQIPTRRRLILLGIPLAAFSRELKVAVVG